MHLFDSLSSLFQQDWLFSSLFILCS